MFDEVHKCKNLKCQNAQLLRFAKGNYTLMLSATVAKKPEYFANCGYMLDLCNNVKMFKFYLKSLSQLNPNDPIMLSLHQKVFPTRGARLRIADLGDLFPKNQVVPELYTMDPAIEQQIQAQYEILNAAVQDLKRKKPAPCTR